MRPEKLPRDPELRRDLADTARWARGFLFAQIPSGSRRPALQWFSAIYTEMRRDAIAMEERHRRELFKGLIEILRPAGGVQ